MPCCERPAVHPCRVTYWEIVNKELDIAQLLKTVQRHTKCSKNYCLKYNRKERKYQCRFKFPIEKQEKSSFAKSESGSYDFLPRRNDEWLNKFNAFISQPWRANSDIAAVSSKEALIGYLTKYISKPEKESVALVDVLIDLLQKCPDHQLVRSPIQKLFVRTCGQRDFSAQEVCHIILGLKMYSSSRQFVFLNMSDQQNEWIPLDDKECLNDEGQFKNKKLMEKYKTRPDVLETVSLWDMASSYNPNTYKKLSKTKVVVIFPKLYNKDNALSEPYCRQQLLLNYPWRDEKTVLVPFSSWKEAYIAVNPPESRPVSLQTDRSENGEDTAESEEDDEDATARQETWMILSRLGVKNSAPQTPIGCRDFDTEFNWSESREKYLEYGRLEDFPSFVNEMKNLETSTYQEYDDVGHITFDYQQSVVLEVLQKQMDYLKNPTAAQDESIPKRTIVQGKAGTGKSLLIKDISGTVAKQFGPGSVLIIAPTGIAALSINGQTAHSALHIPVVAKQFHPLTGERARIFCNQMQDVKVLILDEYSMVGCTLLAMIEQRCRQGTGKHDEPFGDLIVYFFGDVAQLAPVIDPPMYTLSAEKVPAEKTLTIYGREIIASFHACVILSNAHRQESSEFKEILNRLSKGQSTVCDYKTLEKRFSTKVPSEERRQFDNAIRLFAKRADVEDYNDSVVENLIDQDTKERVPVARVPAKNSSPAAEKRSAQDAVGLEPFLCLSKGSKVMLTQNLWTTKGLVNGSIGTVIDLLYEDGKCPPYNPPDAIICDFPSYTGPSIIPDSTIVPIGPITRSWGTDDGQTDSRTQFPLHLCYAITIHRSQGLTLDQVVIDIGNTEFALGMSYVALSRARKLDGLLIEPFSFNRISKLAESSVMKQRIAFEAALDKLGQQTASHSYPHLGLYLPKRNDFGTKSKEENKRLT